MTYCPQPTCTSPSMTYWDCGVPPTYTPPSMTYWDCSMTYCNPPTPHPVWPAGTAVWPTATNPRTTQYGLPGLQTATSLPPTQYDLLGPTATNLPPTQYDLLGPTATNLRTTQYDLLGLPYDLLQPAYPPPSMTYWECSMTYCNQPPPPHPVWPTRTAVRLTATHLHTTPCALLGLQYDLPQPTRLPPYNLLGLQYDLLPPTYIWLSMAYWDWTRCHRPAPSVWPTRTAVWPTTTLQPLVWSTGTAVRPTATNTPQLSKGRNTHHPWLSGLRVVLQSTVPLALESKPRCFPFPS